MKGVVAVDPVEEKRQTPEINMEAFTLLFLKFMCCNSYKARL